MSSFKVKAPVSPVSSSTVNKHSSGGSFVSSGKSNRAKAAATPIPLSAPRDFFRERTPSRILVFFLRV